ncbi:DPP IV N-terminal domain-containing protein [Lysobacter sp. CA199]|uniref:S9 family peptidase n=1 Tax=Lysobacter sp. CA199 TaxID=3455608 RepID=UPI003F8D695F
MKRWTIWGAALCAALSTAAWAQTPALSEADYARAERVLDYNLKGRIKNATVRPNWLADGRFWYRRDGERGVEYILVDPARGERRPLFDAPRLAAAMQVDLPAAPTPELLTLHADDGALSARLRGAKARELDCDLQTYRCAAVDSIHADPGWLLSPDGSRAVFVREHNLWLRDLRSGAERALTRDGERHYGYGVQPDFWMRGIPKLQGRGQTRPFEVVWSPDGRRLFGVRFDERKVLPYPFLALAPEHGFRPVAYELRLTLPGDREPARDEWFAIEVDAGGARRIAIPAGWNAMREAGVLGWSVDNERVYTAIAYDGRPAGARLVEIGLRDGAVRQVLEERSDTRVQVNDFLYLPAAARVLAASGEAVWYSERDGWGHLYLYDLRSGRQIRRLTGGEWAVRDLIGIDERRRRLYFTAGGRESGDPYERRLYRVSLDGGEPTLLTAEQADHDINGGGGTLFDGRAADPLSPARDYVVDTYSTLDQPPRSVLRSTEDGKVIAELERADVSAVAASGWLPPQRLKFKAADGRTDIYATAYFPPDYSRERAKPGQYPVIDAFYGGPQVTNAPVAYVEATAAMNPISRSSLARLGFVVITIDGRGTPGRSRAFHDVSYGLKHDPQVEDHVAAIKQLAERCPGLDLQRVGVYGHSYGGYSSTRAILLRPDFYKVAVSSAGNQNFQGMYGGGVLGLDRLLTGPLDYGNGERLRPSPDAVPTVYRAFDNASLADRLQGKLMLVYGDLDENAYPAVTVQFTSALIRANKDFDLLYLPNQNHELFRNDPYYTRRMWDYFVEHLMGAKPPANYRLKPPPKVDQMGY